MFYCGEGTTCDIATEYCSVIDIQDNLCAWSYACGAITDPANWCPCSNTAACAEHADGSHWVSAAGCNL